MADCAEWRHWPVVAIYGKRAMGKTATGKFGSGKWGNKVYSATKRVFLGNKSDVELASNKRATEKASGK